MEKYKGVYNRHVKRVIDLIFAVILFIVLLPVFLVISVAVMIDTGFPVFYRAQRGGYKGVPFKIFKFRTMVKNADKIGGGTTALNDPRITRVGRFLRKTKLDEVANLISIIKGDMSFIGPRPELLRYTEKYDEREQVILMVRPGITDYSSLQYINLDEIVGEENADEYYEQYVLKPKNEMRIRYANEVSFTTDVKLFVLTVAGVIKKAFKVIFVKEDRNGVH